MAGPSQPRIALPGFGLPINYFPPWSRENNKERFPHAICDHFITHTLTLREKRMLYFVNWFTDLPLWWCNVFNDTVVSGARMVSCVYREELEDALLSGPMFDYCISELRDKACLYGHTRFVAVMDFDATIVKSDIAVDRNVRYSMTIAARMMEIVAPRDWRPGSNGQVLDLVHPSLYPLVFGLSKVLPRGRVPLEDCSQYIGMGETVPDLIRDYQLVKKTSWGHEVIMRPWSNYQWLPSQVDFAPRNGRALITSYINGVHPREKYVYEVLESLVDASIPLWDECLSWFHDRHRIEVGETSNADWFLPEGSEWTREFSPNSFVDDPLAAFERYKEEYIQWWYENSWLREREPLPFVPFGETTERQGANFVDLKSKYKDSGLQVIFKLISIHLTPDKPVYRGSEWQVEGAVNEHICATAIYYYDSHNIKPSWLGFQQSGNSHHIIDKAQRGERSATFAHYDAAFGERAAVDVGSVLTPQGRLVAFPNVIKYYESTIELEDRTMPGHQKMVAMCLVDPNVRILSTANVPPQQKHWWEDEIRRVCHERLPPGDLIDRYIRTVDDFPLSWDKANDIRVRLNDERERMKSAENADVHYETYVFGGRNV